MRSKIFFIEWCFAVQTFNLINTIILNLLNKEFLKSLMALQQHNQSTMSWSVNGSFEGTWDVLAVIF